MLSDTCKGTMVFTDIELFAYYLPVFSYYYGKGQEITV